MDELINLNYESIRRYFITLSQSGYKSYNDVDKLIALIGLLESFDIFQEYLTNKDVDDIIKAVNCLSGSTCLIDFIKHKPGDSLIHKTNINYILRISEDSKSIRITDENVRVMA